VATLLFLSSGDFVFDLRNVKKEENSVNLLSTGVFDSLVFFFQSIVLHFKLFLFFELPFVSFKLFFLNNETIDEETVFGSS